MRNTLLMLVFAACISCGDKKPDLQQQVMALKEMNDLATVEYVVTKMIKANDDQTWYKIGDRKILMSCKAHLIAGIDLASLKKEAIRINDKEIRISLPPAKLVAMNIKPEDIKLEYESVAVFRQNYSTAERDELAVQAEKQLYSSIDSIGILQTAETSASLFVSNFLYRLGFEKVNIDFEKPIALKDHD